MSEQTAGIGHNTPRELTEIISPAVIKDLIDLKLAPLKERATVLINSCKGFIADYTKSEGDKPVFLIENDDQAKEAAEILGTVLAFSGTKSGLVDKTRDAFKRPVIDAGNTIGSSEKGPFFNIAASVDIAAAPIRRAALNYSVAKDAKIKREAIEEAKRKADEAVMAERLASRGSQTVTMDDAIQAAEDAAEAQRVVDAKPATRTFMKGDMAGSSSLIYKRTFTTPHPSLVPRSLCEPSDKLIRAFIGSAEQTHSAKTGWTALPDGKWSRTDLVSGCVVIDEPDLTIRR